MQPEGLDIGSSREKVDMELHSESEQAAAPSLGRQADKVIEAVGRIFGTIGSIVVR